MRRDDENMRRDDFILLGMISEKKNKNKLLSFPHRAKDGAWKV